MKKYIIIFMLLISTSAFGFPLTYTIDNANIDEIASDWIYIYPNSETIPDPEWIDPEDGSEAPRIPLYTDKQWVKEYIRRWVAQQIKRSRQKQSRDDANAIGSTDGLIQ